MLQERDAICPVPTVFEIGPYHLWKDGLWGLDLGVELPCIKLFWVGYPPLPECKIKRRNSCFLLERRTEGAMDWTTSPGFVVVFNLYFLFGCLSFLVLALLQRSLDSNTWSQSLKVKDYARVKQFNFAGKNVVVVVILLRVFLVKIFLFRP